MLRRLTTAVAVILASSGYAMAQETGAVTVVHAIPGVTVDVFVNGDETLPDFEPGTVTDELELPAGSYDLAIAPADAGIDAAILTGAAELEAGANVSIVAHLTEAGEPTISIFANDTSQRRPRSTSACAGAGSPSRTSATS